MTKRRKQLLMIVLAGCFAAGAFFVWDLVKYRDYIDAFSGATPLALGREVPEGVEVTVTGEVKQEYVFRSNGLRLLAKRRVRTREVSPGGELLGTYIYYGVPVLYLLEGVAPEKTEEDVFDRPLDMKVIFSSLSGRRSVFSYGELTMVDDSRPVVLAFRREELLPTKGAKEYKKNKYKGDLLGLKLVCPGDGDTGRYLEDVVKIELVTPETPDGLLPALAKGKKCVSTGLTCIDGEKAVPAVYDGVARKKITRWFRTGHGRGIKGTGLNQAEGFSLASFLSKNFPGCDKNDFFMLVACDGYRSLFSGREIFDTKAGTEIVLLDTLNNAPPPEGPNLAPTADFFVDRNIRGLSHVVRVQ